MTRMYQCGYVPVKVPTCARPRELRPADAARRAPQEQAVSSATRRTLQSGVHITPDLRTPVDARELGAGGADPQPGRGGAPQVTGFPDGWRLTNNPARTWRAAQTCRQLPVSRLGGRNLASEAYHSPAVHLWVL